MANKRKVEVYSAGCPACQETIDLVNKNSCPSCEVTVHNMTVDSILEIHIFSTLYNIWL